MVCLCFVLGTLWNEEVLEWEKEEGIVAIIKSVILKKECIGVKFKRLSWEMFTITGTVESNCPFWTLCQYCPTLWAHCPLLQSLAIFTSLCLCLLFYYTGCEPQYSYWKYAGNMINFCRLYLQYFHSGNILEILWKHWKYSKYRGNFYDILSGNIVDIICGCLLYFQHIFSDYIVAHTQC